MADRIDAYASALFEVARAEGRLERIEADLFSFSQALQQSDQLRTALTDQQLPASRRQQIVEDLLGERAEPIAVALVSFVVGAGHARDLPEIIDRMVRRAAEEKDREVAEVRSAIPLDDEQKRRLTDALNRATGKQVEVRVIVDPQVMGGIVVQVGDTVIDGSVRRRLEELKARL